MSTKIAALAVLMVLASCGTAEKPSGSMDASPDTMADGAGADGNLLADAGAPDVGLDTAPDTASDAVDAAPDAPVDSADVPVDGPVRELGRTDGGVDGAGDASAPADVASICTMPTGAYGPFAGCAPPPNATTCDPVCQSGCACGQRCVLENGIAVCREQEPPFVTTYEACEPKGDRCQPGTICLQESQDHPICGAHCYRHCRVDADCPNAKCSIAIQFGNAATSSNVCSPPMDACDPFGPARCSNPSRPYPTFGCYVMSGQYPDIPICDCAGTNPIGSQCTYEHECEPGAECVLTGFARLCRRVCKVGLPLGTPIALGGCPTLNPTCTAFPGASQFGYCH